MHYGVGGCASVHISLLQLVYSGGCAQPLAGDQDVALGITAPSSLLSLRGGWRWYAACARGSPAFGAGADYDKKRSPGGV